MIKNLFYRQEAVQGFKKGVTTGFVLQKKPLLKTSGEGKPPRGFHTSPKKTKTVSARGAEEEGQNRQGLITDVARGTAEE